MHEDLEQQVARTAALALHAHALLERTRTAPPSPTRAANLARLERAVAAAQQVLVSTVAGSALRPAAAQGRQPVAAG